MPLARPATASFSLLPRFWLPLALLYTVFVIYGSLVPLDFKPLPWHEALERFAQTPYLELGIDARADWVANIVLYVPLTFLWQGIIWPRRHAGLRLLSWIPVFGFGSLLAIAIEFTQLFFPPRTVSLNDIIAEVAGSAIGVVLWYGFGNRIAGLWRKVFAGGPNASRALALLYVAGYLALALFPYDFLVSMQEFSEKAQSGLFNPLMAQSECSSHLHCGFKLVAEITAVIPLGLLLAMSISRQGYSIARAFLIGLFLGFVVEAAQFFIASGVSQGISVLTRGLGMALGAAAYIHLSKFDSKTLVPYSRTSVGWLVAPYLLLLMSANAWFTGDYLNLESALGRIPELNFIPFYYHYYTTEMHALSSLLVVTAMYMPIGLAYWLWSLPNENNRGYSWVPFLFAAFIALMMESGKLFVSTQRPDPTNILIAAFAATITYGLTILITRKSHAVHGDAVEHRAPHTLPAQSRRVSSRSEIFDSKPAWPQRAFALSLLALAMGLSLLHPMGLWLFLPLAAYVGALWSRPNNWMIFVLAALPILDLTPWSGWFFFDEFDLLLLITVAVLGLRQRIQRFKLPFSPLTTILLVCWAASFFVSTMIGLWPIEAIDQNAFSNYYSHYNALRIGKSLIWMLAFLPFISYAIERKWDLKKEFTFGMVLGLTGVVIVVLWERHTFSGLFDFTSDYRTSGNFSGMHGGGAYIDAYLALALPFTVLYFMQEKQLHIKLFSLGLFAGGVYAVLVTFSRGALAALATLGVVMTLAFGLLWMRSKLRYGLTMLIPVLIAAGVALPLIGSSFMQARLEKRTGDLQVRFQHWQGALHMLDSRWQTFLFGAGTGRFPSVFFLNSPEETRLATFRYVEEGTNSYLRLGTGRPLYFEQDLPIGKGRNYLLQIDLRTAAPDAQLDIFVCDKWIVFSSKCKDLKAQSGSKPNQWERRQLAFNSEEVGSLPWHLPVPVKLSLRNLNNGVLIDVDNIQLLDDTGHDLVENGNFSQGSQRWFFTTDDHLPWHIFNMAVHIVFEQGWLGMLLFILIVGYAFVVILRQLWQGQLFYVACLGSLTGFLVVGLFDSVLDSPRISLLFYVFLIFVFTNSAKIRKT